MLKVPYHSQFETGAKNNEIFCGPAAVEMALEYISGRAVPQTILAAEMNTGPQCEGTCGNMMPIPFHSRGYTLVKVIHSDLNTLKELNAQGYVSIINIHGDASHTFGHYVVVVGYDPNGIFVNDPGRRRPGSYIPNTILSDRWTRHNHWLLQIPYLEGQIVSIGSHQTASTTSDRGRTTSIETAQHSVPLALNTQLGKAEFSEKALYVTITFAIIGVAVAYVIASKGKSSNRTRRSKFCVQCGNSLRQGSGYCLSCGSPTRNLPS